MALRRWRRPRLFCLPPAAARDRAADDGAGLHRVAHGHRRRDPAAKHRRHRARVHGRVEASPRGVAHAHDSRPTGRPPLPHGRPPMLLQSRQRSRLDPRIAVNCGHVCSVEGRNLPPRCTALSAIVRLLPHDFFRKATVSNLASNFDTAVGRVFLNVRVRVRVRVRPKPNPNPNPNPKPEA